MKRHMSSTPKRTFFAQHEASSAYQMVAAWFAMMCHGGFYDAPVLVTPFEGALSQARFL
jgi:hypothetical protein